MAGKRAQCADRGGGGNGANSKCLDAACLVRWCGKRVEANSFGLNFQTAGRILYIRLIISYILTFFFFLSSLCSCRMCFLCHAPHAQDARAARLDILSSTARGVSDLNSAECCFASSNRRKHGW